MMSNDYLGLQWKLDMMKAARERWPEMAEKPNIVSAPKGAMSFQVPCIESTPVKWYEDDDPAWGRDHFEAIERGMPLGWEIGYEHIQLEPVGPYQLGYGPRSRVLYVGQEYHVTFTTDETIDLAPNTGHKERVAADKAAGKSPFVRL